MGNTTELNPPPHHQEGGPQLHVAQLPLPGSQAQVQPLLPAGAHHPLKVPGHHRLKLTVTILLDRDITQNILQSIQIVVIHLIQAHQLRSPPAHPLPHQGDLHYRPHLKEWMT